MVLYRLRIAIPCRLAATQFDPVTYFLFQLQVYVQENVFFLTVKFRILYTISTSSQGQQEHFLCT